MLTSGMNKAFVSQKFVIGEKQTQEQLDSKGNFQWVGGSSSDKRDSYYALTLDRNSGGQGKLPVFSQDPSEKCTLENSRGTLFPIPYSEHSCEIQ